jgi:hypothetical protein
VRMPMEMDEHPIIFLDRQLDEDESPGDLSAPITDRPSRFIPRSRSKLQSRVRQRQHAPLPLPHLLV